MAKAPGKPRTSRGISRRTALHVLGAAIGGWSVAQSSTASADPITKTTRSVSVTSLSLRPKKHYAIEGLTLLSAAEPAIIDVTISTTGSGTFSVPWRIEADGAEILSGTNLEVAGGSSFTVTANWQPAAGQRVVVGIADPANTLKAAPLSLKGARKSLAVAVDEWPRWGSSIREGVRFAVDQWKLQAKFKPALVRVNAIAATGSPGCLDGPDLAALIRTSPAAVKMPVEIRDKLAKAIGDAWKAWQDQVTIPGLPWYPSFASVPAPTAPPMVNVATPLVACPSNGITNMSAGSIESRLVAALGSLAQSASAKQVVSLLASSVALGFTKWISGVQVTGVLGYGPVPAFAPPYVPSGPVVNGTVIEKPGSLNNGPQL
ncbi:MAG: hypothetical protein HY898_06505 [Deltaproteobacteria bacterium]|nr:hypothetical protein [Deltaproteobacteria bacterium]